MSFIDTQQSYEATREENTGGRYAIQTLQELPRDFATADDYLAFWLRHSNDFTHTNFGIEYALKILDDLDISRDLAERIENISGIFAIRETRCSILLYVWDEIKRDIMIIKISPQQTENLEGEARPEYMIGREIEVNLDVPQENPYLLGQRAWRFTEIEPTEKQSDKKRPRIIRYNAAIEFPFVPPGLTTLELRKSRELTERWNCIDTQAFVAAVMLQASAGLHALQSAHNDIKPQNLLVAVPSKDGFIRICDFALGHEYYRDPKIITGSPGYTAPEMIDKNPDRLALGRTDMYALGSTAFCLLTGYKLAHGDDWSEVYNRQTTRPFPRGMIDGKGRLQMDCKPEMVDMLEHMTQIEPSRRPANMREVGEWARTFLERYAPKMLHLVGPAARDKYWDDIDHKIFECTRLKTANAANAAISRS